MRPETEAEVAGLVRGARGPLSVIGGGTRLLPGEGQGTRLVSDQMWAIKGQSFPVTRPPALTLVPAPRALAGPVMQFRAATAPGIRYAFRFLIDLRLEHYTLG